MKTHTTDCIELHDDEQTQCPHSQCSDMSYCQECGVKIAVAEDDLDTLPLIGLTDPVDEDTRDMPMVRLEVNGLVLEVPADGTRIVIGSSRDADLRITGDPWVQTEHVYLFMDPQGLHVEDVDSGHGHYQKGGIEDPFLRGGSLLIGTTFIEVR